jgi:hypothetical protein
MAGGDNRWLVHTDNHKSKGKGIVETRHGESLDHGALR